MTNLDVMYSSKKEDWSTPMDFFQELNAEFSFNLDPCADAENHKCERYFTEQQNGLVQDWSGSRVFCNPPYGKKIGAWVEKAFHEGHKEGTLVVLLLPARTDTKYFHDFILHRAEVRFVKGRLRFGGAAAGAPFPSMIVIFRGPRM